MLCSPKNVKNFIYIKLAKSSENGQKSLADLILHSTFIESAELYNHANIRIKKNIECNRNM